MEKTRQIKFEITGFAYTVSNKVQRYLRVRTSSWLPRRYRVGWEGGWTRPIPLAEKIIKTILQGEKKKKVRAMLEAAQEYADRRSAKQ
jgi:hypothetical protein